MTHVFISYRRKTESGFVQQLAERLVRDFGSNAIFYDTKSLSPGEEWWRRLEQEIKDADLFIPIFGPAWQEEMESRAAAEQSDWFCREITTASQEASVRALAIIPVLLDGATDPNSSFEYLQAISKRHCQKLRRDDPGHLEQLAGTILNYDKRRRDHERVTRFYECLAEHRPLAREFETVARRLGRVPGRTELSLGAVERWTCLGQTVGENGLRDALRPEARTTAEALASAPEANLWDQAAIEERLSLLLPARMRPLGGLAEKFDRLLATLPLLTVPELCPCVSHPWKVEAAAQAQAMSDADRELIESSELFVGRQFKDPALFAALAAWWLTERCAREPEVGQELINQWLGDISRLSTAGRLVLELLLRRWPQPELVRRHLAAAEDRATEPGTNREIEITLRRLLYLERLAGDLGMGGVRETPRFVQCALVHRLTARLPEWLACFGERRCRVYAECLAGAGDESTRTALARELRRVLPPDAIPPPHRLPPGLARALNLVTVEVEEAEVIASLQADRAIMEWWLRVLPLPASDAQLKILVRLAFDSPAWARPEDRVRAIEWLNGQPRLTRVWQALGSVQAKWLAGLDEAFRASPAFGFLCDEVRDRGEPAHDALLARRIPVPAPKPTSL